MFPDLFLITILTGIFHRAIPIKGAGDLIGTFMLTLIFYGIAKAPTHCMIGGWTYPVNPDPHIHWISGLVAFILVGGFYILVGYCKQTNQSIWQVIRKHS